MDIELIVIFVSLFIGICLILLFELKLETNNELQQKIVIESMRSKNNLENGRNYLCKKNETSNDKENMCNTLSQTNCKNIDCCILLSNNKCVLGDKSGPIFKTDENDENINIDYYYYKGKCYGESCPKF